MKSLILSFFKDESGATAIEYGLIAAGIAIAIITAVQGVGTQLSGNFDTHQHVAEVTRSSRNLPAPLPAQEQVFCQLLRTGRFAASGLFHLVQLQTSAARTCRRFETRRHWSCCAQLIDPTQRLSTRSCTDIPGATGCTAVRTAVTAPVSSPVFHTLSTARRSQFSRLVSQFTADSQRLLIDAASGDAGTSR